MSETRFGYDFWSPCRLHGRASQSFGRMKMYRVLTIVLLAFIAPVVSFRVRCANGKWEVDRCVCHDDYVGRRCERRIHCSNFMRHPNGSCVACKKWWTGSNCDEILCNPGYGTPTEDLLMCQCSVPATGAHCEILNTDDIYSYYNLKVAQWGPIGALALIPMIVCLMLCNHYEKRRHVRRIKLAVFGANPFYADDDGSSIIGDLQGSDSGP